MNAILKSAPKTKFPANIKPMKAALIDEPFDDPGWIYEIKWGGYRAIAKVDKESSELISRNNLTFDQFAPVNQALVKLNINAVLDGEIVALNEQGNANFGALQNWRNNKNAKLSFYFRRFVVRGKFSGTVPAHPCNKWSGRRAFLL